MMQTCEVIYGCERAAQVQAFLEGAMGEPCPCKRDLPCPLMPPSPETLEAAEPPAA